MLLVIGFIFMIFIFAVISLITGIGLFFMDLPSIFLMLVSLAFFLTISKSGHIMGRYIKNSFKKEYTYTAAELTALSAAIKNSVKFIMITGAAAFLLGFIIMFAFLEDPQKFGPNLSVCLITLLYSVTISCFIFLPVQAWAENKINSTEEPLK